MTSLDIELQNLREMQQALRRAGGTPDDAKRMNRDVVDELIVPEAKREVPVRRGRLKESIRSDSTAVYGYILAGSRGDVAYGGVIHFGWSTRGLGRLVAGTAKERRAALSSALERSSGTRTLTSRATNKAARHALGGKNRGAVRGGPIRPQPFIYDAIDHRANEVEDFYDRQLAHRFELEGLL